MNNLDCAKRVDENPADPPPAAGIFASRDFRSPCRRHLWKTPAIPESFQKVTDQGVEIAVPLAEVIQRVRELAAPYDARPVSAEIVGLVHEASIVGLPEDLPLPCFDPARHVIERRVRA